MNLTNITARKKPPVYSDIVESASAYLGVLLNTDGKYTAHAFWRKSKTKKQQSFTGQGSLDEILIEIENFAKKNKLKFVAAGIVNRNKDIREEDLSAFGSKLWLNHDVVPVVLKTKKIRPGIVAKYATKKAYWKFSRDNIAKIKLGKRRKVITTPLVRPEDYEKLYKKDVWSEFINLVKEYSDKDQHIVFFSSTPRGGGVALMRHALMRLFESLEIDASWHVMTGNRPEIFNITKKKFHNVLQGVAPPEDKLTKKDKSLYEKWIKENVKLFTPIFRRATIIVIDDPQPSGMIPYIKKINPDAKLFYRSHIQIDTELLKNKNTTNYKTWEYLWNYIRLADVFVSHPVKSFVPPNVPKGKIVYKGATTDELDGLNKPLTKEQTDYYLSLFNLHLAESNQTPLDTKRPFISQIARFDPSKGIPDVIAAYRTLRDRLEEEGVDESRIPQLVIAGHGAIDDPEGAPILEETKNRLNMDVNKRCAKDIKIARLPHVDQLLNVLLSESEVILQLSHKEGFEIKVSEALFKGRPVVAYKAGGIPVQIKDGVTGHLVDIGNTAEVAEHLHKLITDKEYYKKMSENAKTKVHREFFTIGNAIFWLQLCLDKISPKNK